MAVALSPALVGLVTLVIGAIFYSIRNVLKIGVLPAKLPPGPPTKPLLGNLAQIDFNYPQKQFTEWAKTYGPVYTIMQGATPVVVVSGAAEAKELFGKKGQHTSARPPLRFHLMMRGDFTPSLMGGPKWRSARKLWHAILNVGAAKQYLPYQTLEAKKLLFDLSSDAGSSGEDGSWRNYVERYSNSVAMTMVNGRRVLSAEDPAIAETLDDLAELSLLGAEGAVLDCFPFLWSLPQWLFPVIGKAKRSAVKHTAYILKWYDSVKQSTEKEGSVRLPSFNLAIQEKLSRGWDGLTETEGAEIAQTLLGAGTDTTSSSLVNFIGAMALYPEVQRKAQEDIDRVVGSERMPQDDDESELPYIRQIIMELQRWLTVVPLALPHATSEDVAWGEYVIPKGTGMYLNAWAIHSDPATYPNPAHFQPERWADKLETITSDDQLGVRTELYSFGGGRRVCPGQHLAERSLFLGISHMLWAFNIQKKRDANGNELPIDPTNIRAGAITALNNFAVDITTRSPQKAELISKTWSDFKSQFLDKNEQWSASPDAVGRNIAKLSK